MNPWPAERFTVQPRSLGAVPPALTGIRWTRLDSTRARRVPDRAEIAELLKLNPQTVRNWIDAGDLPAVRVGKRRVRIRQSDLDAFIAAGSTPRRDAESLPAEEVDEGSVTAWATFGAAMADATATLERADRIELLSVLERLTQATQALVDSLGGDAASPPHGG